MLATKARAMVIAEASKGCTPDFYPEPIALEPAFNPAGRWQSTVDRPVLALANPELAFTAAQLVHARVWIPTDNALDWRRSERVLKQLASASHRIAFEIAGHEKEIRIGFVCSPYDFPVLRAAFRGEFARAAVSLETDGLEDRFACSACERLALADFYPAPPYSHLLTRPDELAESPYEPLIATLASLPPTAWGACQVLFQPVAEGNNWHANVEMLRDLEFLQKMLTGPPQLAMHYGQQGPSGDLRQMAWELEGKAHNDKPFFAAAFRVAVKGPPESISMMFRAVATFARLYQHGGRPLSCVTEREYGAQLPLSRPVEMLTLGISYRPGFLVNSWELAGLVHLPTAKLARLRQLPLQWLNTLPVQGDLLRSGTRIGYCRYAGEAIPVHIPERYRTRHVHAIGRSDMGKSGLLEQMALEDARAGYGLAVLDPHGDLVERLLDQLPKEVHDRIIYFDPGDRNWVPLWNPLKLLPGQDPGRVADDLVGALKSFFDGWGHRLEQILGQSFYAFLQLPGSSLLDVVTLLRRDPNASEQLRQRILQTVQGEDPKRFWEHDFPKYGKDDLGPPKNKLSKLLIGGTTALMLSQPDSAFDFRQIMDEGKIFLANLSGLGSEVRELLGCLLLTLLHQSALGRSDMPEDLRRPYHIYLDEAHRFMTDSLEDVIAECRKYRVGLTLAHHYLSQFTRRKADALLSTGSTIIFNVDRRDAEYLAKDLRKLVKVDDLITLDVGQAVVRCGSQVVRIETIKPADKPAASLRDRIIEESRRRYCRPADEVRRELRRKHGASFPVIATETAVGAGREEEFLYDVLA